MKIVSHFDHLFRLSGVICRWQDSGQFLCSLVSRSRLSTERLLMLKDALLISALCYQKIVHLLKRKKYMPSCSTEDGEVGMYYSSLKVVVVQCSFVYSINLQFS